MLRLKLPGGAEIETVEVLVSQFSEGIHPDYYRAELPTISYYFGRDIGLVGWAVGPIPGQADQSHWSVVPLTLPPPTPDGSVVEYHNSADFPESPLGHYFYAATEDERARLDQGEMGAFRRTGYAFKGGGYVPVCRFYGSLRPGPNAHQWIIDADRCAALQRQTQHPVPTTQLQWNYEGTAFYASRPTQVGAMQLCPAGTETVYAVLYSAPALDSPFGARQRFTTDRSVRDAMLMLDGSRDGGVAFCAPA